MTRVFDSLETFKAAAGEELGTSDWVTVTQEQINTFADATGDHQWIHVDPERAATGPFGGTIAHGYLTLSLTNYFQPMLFHVDGAKLGINYGTNKVRFPAPVRCGSRIRMGTLVGNVEDVGGGVQVTLVHTIEVEGGEKPACVVESVGRWVF